MSGRIGVIGGGSAAEALARSLSGRADITVFEPGLVGGECPFLACMPSKSMLHDSRCDVPWDDAVRRRQQITNGLDDSRHAGELDSLGVALVREAARIVDASTVSSGRQRHDFDHIVLAAGAAAVMPDLRIGDGCDDRIWTSEDVYRSDERPERAVIIGAGVIGSEIADLYSGFGTEVTVLEYGERAFADMPPVVGEVVTGALQGRGVDIRFGVTATSVDLHDRERRTVRVTLTDESHIDADRVVVAMGRRPRTDDLGLEHLGLDPSEPLPVLPNGRVDCSGSVWAIGDVAGGDQYTHLANHHAAVVADHLVGSATRRFDDVVLGSCMFTSPPLVQVGPSWAELRDDADIVDVGYDLDGFPRASTDRLAPGHLWVAARRSTGTVVAAAGAGPSFDELVHALIVAIDGEVPVERLRRSMQPFPTIGEILGPIWEDLAEGLAT